MSRASAGDWAGAFFLVVIIYVLVRPSSAAAAAVDLFSKAMTSIVRGVTDM